MPSISIAAPALRATSEGLSLSLQAAHRLILSSDPDPVLSVVGRMPDSIDVLSSSDIIFSLRGSLNHVQLSCDGAFRLAQSVWGSHDLMQHSKELGLSHISRVYIDNDGAVKFAISSAHILLDSHQSPAPTVTLVALTLTFSYLSCVSDASDSCFVHPFSPQLLLPIQSTLNTVLEKFLSCGLVRRYPLIFGPWRSSLDAELTTLPHICQSVLDIIHRSRNCSFRRKCLRMIKALKTRQTLAFSESLTELQLFLGQSVTDQMGLNGPRAFGDEYILSMAMQRLYRSFVRPQRFKTFATILTTDDAERHPFDLSQAASSILLKNDLHESTQDGISDYDVILDGTLLSPEFEPVDPALSQSSFLVSTEGSPLVLTPIPSPSGHSISRAIYSENSYVRVDPVDLICTWPSDDEYGKNSCQLANGEKDLDHHDVRSREWTPSPIPNMDPDALHPETFVESETHVFLSSPEKLWCAGRDDELLDFGDD